MFRSASFVTLFVAALAAFAACTNSTATTPPPPASVNWTLATGASDSTGAFQGLNYYPNSITINAGDSVTWTIASSEPHTISLLGAGQPQPPPPIPTNLNPAGGSSYDGSTYVSSGLLTKGKTYRLTFPKAGTYKAYCLIHQPEMLLTIVVQPRGSRYPSTQAQYNAAGAASSGGDLAAATGSLSLFPYSTGGPQLAAGIAPGLAHGPPSNSTVLRS